MIFAKLSILSGLAAVAIADTTINVDNLPVGCKDVCSQVSGISNGCKTNSSKPPIGPILLYPPSNPPQQTMPPLPQSASAPPTTRPT